MKPGSLIVVGTGIKAVGQATLEAAAYIRRAEKLFYLVTDPVTEQWLRDLNATAESLYSSYVIGRERQATYEEMVERVLFPVRAGLRVCLASYGHPGVCAYSPHEAVRRARGEGYRASMLPGVSCEDALFADLGVDPAENGCQSYEADRFLIYRRVFDPHSALVLWQIAFLGQSDFRSEFSSAGLPLLAERLASIYGGSHGIKLYEAAVYPVCTARIRSTTLAELPEAEVFPATTLYVPPLSQGEPDGEVMRMLAARLSNCQRGQA